jgi:hypothetical protein
MTEPTISDIPRRPVLRFLKKAVANWRERHRHPFNFWIHMIGIPIAPLLVLLLLATALFLWEPWPLYWAAGAFVLGYFLQFVGHCVEGNDLGEWAGIKRLLGRPYVGIAPRWQPEEIRTTGGTGTTGKTQAES